MQSHDNRTLSVDLTRAKRILEARKAGPEASTKVERDVAVEVVGLPTVKCDDEVRQLTYPQHGYLSPMAATEAFARELQRALAGFASNLGKKAPKPGKYNPLVATPTLTREVWRARQVIDSLGIPYWFYVEYAAFRWYELGHKRMPRPSQLTSPDIAMHVMQLWEDPAFRWNYPLFDAWDERFQANRYCGNAVQDRALALIDQRLKDAGAMGHDKVAVLASLIGTNISMEEARRRYGETLTESASRLNKGLIDPVDEALAELGFAAVSTRLPVETINKSAD